MTGTEVKELILKSGLKCWQVAAEMGMNDGNFSRRLRKPFNEAEAEHVTKIIESLKGRTNAN